jgi:hypothetical protein
MCQRLVDESKITFCLDRVARPSFPVIVLRGRFGGFRLGYSESPGGDYTSRSCQPYFKEL